MKKLLLLALIVFGGVMNAGAWNYLEGSFNNWSVSPAYCLDNGPVAVYLTVGNHSFKIYTGDWYGANNNASITETTTISNFTKNGNNDNFELVVTTPGYYVFSTNWDNGLSLTVRYPNTMVYFYNALGWTNVYLHDGWWNGDNGATNLNALRGIAMTAEGNGIYSAYIPHESLYRITFTSDKQVNEGDGQYGAGYENFYSTSVVWNADAFNVNTPLYIPTTTISETKNYCSYYYGGEWHAYPTYTRDVTSGNWGTICLPFAATVTGADVYKVVSTVGTGDGMTGINLESVATLEAGKPYIFQATDLELVATYSGSYADASAAFGMMGNLSSTPVDVEAGYYVVSGNKVKKVVSGGSGVTCGQYRAYITLDGISPAAARGAHFIGFDDETTGIESIQAEENQNEVYNLQGQRVMNGQKGMFIVNGKKVIRK